MVSLKQKKSKTENGILWKFIPATALALSAIVIFFVVQETSVNNVNPYIDGVEQPLQIADNTPDTINLRAPSNSKINEDSYLVIEPNDVIKKERVTKPRPPLNGVDVDNYIDGTLRNNSRSRNQHVVGGSRSFNGFLVDKDRKEIEKLRARLDSIKAAEKKKKNAK
jgi:hypothetical protein